MGNCYFIFWTSNSKHDWTPVKYKNVLHENRTLAVAALKYFIAHVKFCLSYLY